MRLGSRRYRTRATLLRAALVLPAWLLLPASASGQVMIGQVVDAVTGTPVAGVTVRAIDADSEERLVVLADSTGHFSITLPAGLYAFRVEGFGYETLETERIAVVQGERVQVEIRLGPLPLEVQPLVVQARQRTRATQFQRRLEQRRATGLGRFITREDIEATAAISVNHLITRELGLELATVRGTEVIVIRSRGRRCMPVLYVDGIRVVHDRTFPMDLSHLFHPDMIEGIEIYRTPIAAPADLQTNGCGAIAVWSRTDVEGEPFTVRRLAIAAGWVVVFLLLRAL